MLGQGGGCLPRRDGPCSPCSSWWRPTAGRRRSRSRAAPSSSARGTRSSVARGGDGASAEGRARGRRDPRRVEDRASEVTGPSGCTRAERRSGPAAPVRRGEPAPSVPGGRPAPAGARPVARGAGPRPGVGAPPVALLARARRRRDQRRARLRDRRGGAAAPSPSCRQPASAGCTRWPHRRCCSARRTPASRRRPPSACCWRPCSRPRRAPSCLRTGWFNAEESKELSFADPSHLSLLHDLFGKRGPARRARSGPCRSERVVAEQVPRAGPLAASGVVRVVQGAGVERQAATADAAVEPGAELL